jgi:hypothetical protein
MKRRRGDLRRPESDIFLAHFPTGLLLLSSAQTIQVTSDPSSVLACGHALRIPNCFP